MVVVDVQKMNGMSILVDRLYWGYKSGKRTTMTRSSIKALKTKYTPSNTTATSQYRLTAMVVPIIARMIPE
jgi:hypothetical protein